MACLAPRHGVGRLIPKKKSAPQLTTAAGRFKVFIMRIDVTSRSPADAQAALKKGLPKTYIQIAGTSEELDEPSNLIREAARAITVGKAAGRRPSVTALNAIGLLTAASLRAKTLGRWSMTQDYDPRTNFLRLHELARTNLGPVRGLNHAVTQLRESISDTLRILGEPAR